ncbi:MAG: DUF3999 family protein [Acidobacteriota bacterium]|nr:DUF3999 family protein [Acidobacteriota bacterium]
MTIRSLAAMLIVMAVAAPQQKYFRYERPLIALPVQSGQTCVSLDDQVFAHSERNLADVRLYEDGIETPYAVNTASAAEYVPQLIHPLNVGVRGGHTVFDAEMPEAPYSDLDLNVTAHNFIATVTVTGSRAEDGHAITKLGDFTIFDFTRERLGRSTVLHLPLSNFVVLHFSISGGIAPDDITGISAMKGAQEKARYITVAQTDQATEKDRSTEFTFTVSAHIPVDRVVFVPGSQPAQFSRPVSIIVEDAAPPSQPNTLGLYSVAGGGNLLRIHSVHNGRRIDEENLAIPAPLVTGDGVRKWTVSLENGDDAPIPFQQLRLEMRERQLCFDAAAGASYSLYYGDSVLDAPRYDYATLFALQDNARQAKLGPEMENTKYTPRPDARPFTEKHPSLLWAALLLVIMVLGLVALRTVKRQANLRR